MKTNILIILALFIFGKPTLAQYDSKAFGILEAMSQKYKQLQSFEASISYAMVNKIEGINENFTGKITVQGDKFRLLLDEQEIINNGKTVWTHMASLKEVVVDHVDPDEISPSKFYSIYKKGYKYLYLEEREIEGKACHVVDLVPEQRDAQFFKIRMNIIKKDKSVQSWVLFDRSGSQYRYTISQFVGNPKVSDSFFMFNVKDYPNVEVIDLR